MTLKEQIIEIVRKHINANIWADENAEELLSLIRETVKEIKNPCRQISIIRSLEPDSDDTAFSAFEQARQSILKLLE